ncbi:acryloyl-CoA reductase [Alkalihalobacillus sp. LMS39]|uniref:acrylyl-CoA reductase family protein n=1 Tax=Alkalihalobacillus sp. LMS39 TaxID=2924032 RepID=UPI001FB4B042|nr:acryloyl-CoA reductase [Alkalihalobacillus sp. LMS39]UOE94608.1 acryloyl-CoA reductase [Alkalihalobacillus sp. LMS39]
MEQTFQALIAMKADSCFSITRKECTMSDLPEGEVTIKVSYSSVNYKDALACSPTGKVVTKFPMVPGIDLAGIVVDSTDSKFKKGDSVLVTGYDLGTGHFGGYSEYARVKSEWVVPLPDGLSLKEAMIYGTAGFTAALSIERLEQDGLTPDSGPILVTGATGGVGSLAIGMLHKRGYDVVASSGKESEKEFLLSIGANEVISRNDILTDPDRPLSKQKWAAAVDAVGGKALASIVSSLKQHGAVAVSGLTAGTAVHTTVFPFILRGVTIFGIDSAYCPMDLRIKIWKRLATDLKPASLDKQLNHEITIEQLPETLALLLDGKHTGRTIVKLH